MKKATEGWRELEDGGRIIDAGNAVKYKTGDWRTFRPIWDEKKCTHCMICWLTCPDSSIPAKDKKRMETDYDHCKGCGICAEVCPVKCIKMQSEADFQ
jgi:pyruvate ferredoxin oxidoreductase delta subunit